MSSIEEDLEELQAGGVKFDRLVVICKRHFEDRQGRGSHHIFKTPWPGDPRINLQAPKGSSEAKKYQVRQVIEALAKLQALIKEREKEKER